MPPHKDKRLHRLCISQSNASSTGEECAKEIYRRISSYDLKHRSNVDEESSVKTCSQTPSGWVDEQKKVDELDNTWPMPRKVMQTLEQIRVDQSRHTAHSREYWCDGSRCSKDGINCAQDRCNNWKDCRYSWQNKQYDGRDWQVILVNIVNSFWQNLLSFQSHNMKRTLCMPWQPGRNERTYWVMTFIHAHTTLILLVTLQLLCSLLIHFLFIFVLFCHKFHEVTFTANRTCN